MINSRSFLFGAVILFCLGGRAQASLIVNGGFENETPAGCQLCNNPPPGWTANGGATVDAAFPNSGIYDEALFTSPQGGAGTISQDVPTTPGQAYVLSFAALDEAGLPSDTLTVTFGGFTAVLTGDQLQSYVDESFTLPGTDVTSTTTTLTFSAINDVQNFNIDDVSIDQATTTIPEPNTVAILLVALAVLAGLRLTRRTAGSMNGGPTD